MSRSILIVGGDSLLGAALASALSQTRVRVGTTTRRPGVRADHVLPLDLGQALDTWQVPAECSAVVLCAAVTSLEACRQDPEQTRRVNVDQTLALARKAAAAGCFVVFPSTNLVFDGLRPQRPPGDAVCPTTEYGRQKASAEAGVLALGDQAAVVRLTKVFHPGMPLLQRWRRALAAGQVILPYTNLICAPITLAVALACLRRVTLDRRPGLWQCSSPEDASYADVASWLATSWGYPPSLVSPAPAPRQAGIESLPRFATLDTTRVREELGLVFPAARQAVESAA